ncbi:hypothetical protein TorRG33x02_343270 [Trema orientale]|uniref:Uncharacterized protein n=1 Tax=Trema orientale TaxID=63057 RepID=A0A2P5ARS3_TREOI|nr:hypothetical protein TorRG33x02_343270 [Trema orientale]
MADLVILTKNVRIEITARMFMVPSTIVFGSEDHIMIGHLLGIIIRIVPLFGFMIGIGDEIRISTFAIFHSCHEHLILQSHPVAGLVETQKATAPPLLRFLQDYE